MYVCTITCPPHDKLASEAVFCICRTTFVSVYVTQQPVKTCSTDILFATLHSSPGTDRQDDGVPAFTTWPLCFSNTCLCFVQSGLPWLASQQNLLPRERIASFVALPAHLRITFQREWCNDNPWMVEGVCDHIVCVWRWKRMTLCSATD